MITTESLHLSALSATTEVQRLALYAEQSAQALAAAEQRAEKAEAQLKASKARQANLKTGSADLVVAAQQLLDKMDSITTAQFACGAEKAEREALRQILEVISGVDNERS